MIEVNKRLDKIEATLQEQDNAIYGQWDIKKNERQPGIIEKLDEVNSQVALMLKILKYAIGPLAVVCTLAASGPYAKDIFPVVLKLIAAIFTH